MLLLSTDKTMAKSKSNKSNPAASRWKNAAEKAAARGKALARRANESRMVAKAAGSAGAVAGGFVGGRFARTWTIMDEKANGVVTKRGMDLVPIAGGGLMAAGLVLRGVAGDVIADAGGAALGASLGTAAAIKAAGLTEQFDAAIAAKKAKK